MVNQEGPRSALEISGPTGEHRFELDDHPSVDIGRGQDNVLCLTSEAVSRRHALIRRRGDAEYSILDLGSRNGTEVNGWRIQHEVSLFDGDRIQVGEYEMVFRCRTQQTRTQTAAPTAADSASTRLVVNQKCVSVLVMDLLNYTGLSQQMGNAQLSALLAKLSSRATVILAARRAWNHKMIGDAVMAVWLHDTLAGEKEVIRRPLAAAVEIAEMVRSLGQEFQLPQELVIRAGISTGEASMGGLGAEGKLEVIGDTVNLAFRLEAATRKLGSDMLLCGSTKWVVGTVPFELFHEQTVELKGFAEPVRAFGIQFGGLKEWLGPVE